MDFDENITLSSFISELSKIEEEEEVSHIIDNTIKKKVIAIKNLQKCNDYCNDHRILVDEILKKNGIELLSHAVGLFKIYLPTLCKTIILFGENHFHHGTCDEFGYNKSGYLNSSRFPRVFSAPVRFPLVFLGCLPTHRNLGSERPEPSSRPAGT